MPYVKQTIRDRTDYHIGCLDAFVQRLPDNERDGALNYIISELVSRSMKPETGWRYHYLHRAYGVFMAAGAEFYRRLVAPYEDRAIHKNGDISGYKGDFA